MKVVITGSDGQLGQSLIRTAPADWQVVALNRQALDITQAHHVQTVLAALAADWLVNAAAYTGVDAAESHPMAAEAVNVMAVGHLARAVDTLGMRMVHVSTDYVFNGQGNTFRRPSDPVAPLGVYGRTKAAGETLVQTLLAERGLVVRTAWLHASHGRNFVRTMLELLRSRQTVPVVADQIGTPTAAPALASALWGLMRLQAHGLLHWTQAGLASWYDLAETVRQQAMALELLHHPGTVIPVPTEAYATAARRPRFSVLDCREAWSLLGSPPAHWTVGVRQVLQEMKP